MTAIAGYWAFDGSPVSALCARMLQGQSAYGRQRAQEDDGTLALGRNLYAVLPEDVHDRRPQSRGVFRLVADVRIDNREDLAATLGISSLQQTRLSDAGLLFEALLKWRSDAVNHLVGEFAFAFWDGARQELLLGRDILGLRPLYYHCGKNFFAFASMPSGLHALEGVPYDFDPNFVAERLALIPHVGSNSYFRGIERVRSAHFVQVTRDRVRTHHYWYAPRPSPTRSSPEAYEEGLRGVLEQAVKSHMRGTGSVVASHLSAGLDSSTVTASAARLFQDRQVIAYTAVPRAGFDGRTPPGSVADEGPLAAATARLYPNIEHVLIESSGESPLAGLNHSFLYQQEPSANLTNSGWGRAISRAASERGVNTILKGSLGNLTISFSGLELLPSLLARGHWLKLARLAVLLNGNGMPLLALSSLTLGPFVPPLLWPTLRRLGRRSPDLMSFSAVSRAWLAETRPKDERRTGGSPGQTASDSLTDRLQAFAQADGGNSYKGVLAEFGLSIRDPTGDRRVIEYTLATPVEEFVRGGVPRSLARRAFADRLPPEVATWKMRGYQSADWHEALDRARPEIEQEVASILRCTDAGEALDLDWLKNAVDSWPRGGWDQFQVRDRYRLGLMRGIAAGHFMRRVRGTN